MIKKYTMSLDSDMVDAIIYTIRQDPKMAEARTGFAMRYAMRQWVEEHGVEGALPKTVEMPKPKTSKVKMPTARPCIAGVKVNDGEPQTDEPQTLEDYEREGRDAEIQEGIGGEVENESV
jgi:hypothetical protein